MPRQRKSRRIALPKKYRAVGYPPSDVEKLICKTCWNSPFWWNSPCKAITEDPVRKALPQDGSRFHIRVQFSQHLEVEDDSRTKRPADRKTSLYLNVERLQFEDLPVQTYSVHSAKGDPAAKFLPQVKVLLDVNSTLAHDLIKKYCKDLEHPWLFVNRQCIEDKYVALSYVWGCEQPHCTTGQNLESYRVKGIPLEYIPKTIMDAIAVTRDLGFRYLWVDAFCIIQDSKDDKAREIRQIRQIRRIFSDAYLTIIAACAGTVNDGFLHERHPPVPTPITLPFRCPDGAIGTMQLRIPFNLPDHHVDERAWCLEERLLSPRKVIYTAHTLRSACEKASENLGSDSNFLQDTSDMLSLSRPISSVRATSNGGPEVDLTDACCSRPNRNCAPSWSWASTDGEVDVNIYDFTTDEILCTVIQCDAVVAHQENPYGDVKGGTLVLDAILISAMWDPGSNRLFDAALCMPTDSSQSPEWSPFEKRFGGNVIPDTLETVSQEICGVQLVMIKLAYDILQGLVLVPTDPNSSTEQNAFPTFRRVGFFDYVFRAKGPDIARLSCARQHIKII
ncbi:heterokaryon incompatibility protein-domain-containing protein [Armillaria nabsnona]|nr:heterokaryon incompatibility protein-domain-containing protein [Armillaria nabsnona]